MRSLHDRLFVDPVRRVVAQEVENASVRMEASIDEARRDLERILGDLADANDQVAEAIGRSLTRLRRGDRGRSTNELRPPGPGPR